MTIKTFSNLTITLYNKFNQNEINFSKMRLFIFIFLILACFVSIDSF